MRILPQRAVTVIDGIALPKKIITKTNGDMLIDIHKNIRLEPYARGYAIDILGTVRIGFAAVSDLIAQEGLRCPGKSQHFPRSPPIHTDQPTAAIIGLMSDIVTALPGGTGGIAFPSIP